MIPGLMGGALGALSSSTTGSLSKIKHDEYDNVFDNAEYITYPRPVKKGDLVMVVSSGSAGTGWKAGFESVHSGNGFYVRAKVMDADGEGNPTPDWKSWQGPDPSSTICNIKSGGSGVYDAYSMLLRGPRPFETLSPNPKAWSQYDAVSNIVIPTATMGTLPFMALAIHKAQFSSWITSTALTPRGGEVLINKNRKLTVRCRYFSQRVTHDLAMSATGAYDRTPPGLGVIMNLNI